jgi:hypothetical protein
MDATPLSTWSQSRLAAASKLKEECVQSAILVPDHVRAHDAFVTLLHSGYDQFLLDGIYD